LEAFVDGFAQFIDYVGASELNDSEVQEPSCRRFAAEATLAALSSPSEGKRRLLGRLVARRCGTKTEGVYECLLRDALEFVGKASEEQLSLLGALVVSSFTPMPLVLADGKTPDKVATELYGDAVEALSAVTWARVDIERLISSGLVEEITSSDINASHIVRANPRPSATVPIASDGQFRTTFHDRINNAFGAHRSHTNWGWSREPINELWPNPVGAVIGCLVLECHVLKRIRFAEWENVNPAPDELVAPFSSTELSEHNRRKNAGRRAALSEVLKKKAPAAVADELKRGLRGIGSGI
jgi:hypothetical protein